MTDVTERLRPGRQRSEAADTAILAATLDVLSDVGYAGLTVASVITKAKVSSATLYRRWPTKQELVAAALASLHAEIVDIDTGSFRKDVEAMAAAAAEAMTVRRQDLAEDVAVELRRNPEFRAAVNEIFVVPRRAVMNGIIERAVARKELSQKIDSYLAMSFLSGPMHQRVYLQGQALTPTFLKQVTVGAIAAMQAIADLER